MTVAELSDLFVWSAATALTITLIAWSMELARITEAAQAARTARTVREPATVGAGGSAVPAASSSGGAPPGGARPRPHAEGSCL